MREGARAPHTVIAFDFGTQRIGIAAGDTLTCTAAPRPAISVHERGPDWVRIAQQIEALRPQRLIVGAPYNVDGSPGALAASARQFAAELAHRFALPVEMVDERWSSLEAAAALKARRASGARRRRVRREDIDSTAAAIILERWLSGEGGPT
jgi:putative Holliday junction resolvase